MRGLVLIGLILVATAVGTAAPSSLAERAPEQDIRNTEDPAVVASLEPAATAKLWRQLVEKRVSRAGAAADCRPLRAVFYAATDYLRLATKLAASTSPCAQYYVSIPPLVADKTRPRPNAAWRVRALGPNFHAMAEIHFTTWNRWVAETGSSWHAAGVTARERMAATGYEVASGDTWVLNEASSAVRRGTGNARANLREFLRGLYEGDGTRPTRGAVFVIGIGQRSSDLSLLQTNLQNWFADSAFWADMATYVSDWSQEVYGDVRSWAIPGMATSTRRDYLNDYLQHKLLLANAGPPTVATARSYLQTAFSPLANAAWEREAGYGWTMVPAEQMAGYVSAQVHALRYFTATSGQAQDHWGFAWAPRNGTGMSASEFATRTSLILDRLAAAVRDSGETVDPADPGSAACGPPGQNVWCVGDLEGARPNEGWKSFRTWTQAVLAFATPPQTVSAGSPSGPMSLSLVTATGIPVTTPVPLTVTVSSSSDQGTFSASPTGPWAPTLTLPIAAGTGTSGVFYYLDARAGSHVLTASAAGVTSGTQTMTVTPGSVTALTMRPAAVTLRARSTQRFTVAGTDAHGNSVPVSAAWSLTPQVLGTIAPRTGPAAMLTAGRELGPGTLTATVTSGGSRISEGASVRVLPGKVRVGSIRYRGRKSALLVTVNAVDAAGRPVSRARVSVLVRRDGRALFGARAVTGAAGKAVVRVPARRGGCFVATIRRVAASGFAWDGRTPRNRFCRPRSG